MNGRLNLFFDWKAMGINAYLPLLILVLSVWAGRYFSTNQLLPMLEAMLPAFAAWWSIFLFQDLLEEPGGETIFSYPISRLQLGLFRVLFFLAGYLLFLLASIALIDVWFPEFVTASLFLQFATQSIFFAGLGYASVVLFRNCGWSLVVLILYSCTQIFTKGELFPYVNVYLFNDRVLPISAFASRSVTTFLCGVLLLTLGQILLNRQNRFH
ncbi:hypothetical protein CIG75_17240 [Tumebacillus algifaecis]|uniref:Uncharacterized protein n=1 Tax=Tumebacillus algifaecis TaxID=1214604 RepID=A0A223D4N0_9BACL|nr:hypothetical protein [Tumebacillus algifaecis]ASS76531.1 hypothetical protein CIG75_17240 [Tumebacillus algifaecis]